MRLLAILKNPDIRNAVAQCGASTNPTNPNFIRTMDEYSQSRNFSSTGFCKTTFPPRLTQPAYHRIACVTSNQEIFEKDRKREKIITSDTHQKIKKKNTREVELLKRIS